MKQPNMNRLIENYLNLMFEVGINKSEIDEPSIEEITKSFIKRKATQTNISRSDILDNLSIANTIVRRKFEIAYLHVEETVDKPSDENQYRYSLSSIANIYKEFAGKEITRQTVNDHKYNNKLTTVKLHGEYASVLESDLIDYFFRENGIRLEPQQIRKYYYKKPL